MICWTNQYFHWKQASHVPTSIFSTGKLNFSLIAFYRILFRLFLLFPNFQVICCSFFKSFYNLVLEDMACTQTNVSLHRSWVFSQLFSKCPFSFLVPIPAGWLWNGFRGNSFFPQSFLTPNKLKSLSQHTVTHVLILSISVRMSFLDNVQGLGFLVSHHWHSE